MSPWEAKDSSVGLDFFRHKGFSKLDVCPVTWKERHSIGHHENLQNGMKAQKVKQRDWIKCSYLVFFHHMKLLKQSNSFHVKI